MLVKLLSIFDMWSSTVDPSDLYENGIVEPIRSMLVDISHIPTSRLDRITIETLVELLRILDNLLRYLSDVVKRALQAKKTPTAGGASADSLAQLAERLLHANRPLVACNQYLISLVNTILREIISLFRFKCLFFCLFVFSLFMRTTI